MKIAYNEIKRDGGAILLASLKYNNALSSLILTGNDIVPSDEKEKLDLTRNKTLKTLVLGIMSVKSSK